MRFQSHANSCGPATVANVLRAMGRDITEAAVTKRCENAGAIFGTAESRIFLALDKLKLNHHTFRQYEVEAAWSLLYRHLDRGRPVILAVDDNEHWVGAIGLLGERVLICDPAHDELVVSVSRKDLAPKWSHYDEKGAAYYGIVVGGPKEQR